MWFCDHIDVNASVYSYGDAVALREAYISRNDEEITALKTAKQVHRDGAAGAARAARAPGLVCEHRASRYV